VLLICVASAQRTRAQDARITWRAPSECPSEASLLTRVARALGDHELAPAHTVSVRVAAKSGGGYRAKLQIQSPKGPAERTLENPSCEVLADSVALVIALSAGYPASKRASPKLLLSAHTTATHGPLPQLALGAGGALAVEGLAALRFEAGASLHFGQSLRYSGSSVGASFGLIRVGARLCRVWTLGRLDLAPCLGAELYRVAADGFGGETHHAGTAYLFGPALGAHTRLRLFTHFSVSLGLDASAPLARRGFVYEDLGLLHRPAVFAFQLWVAPEVQL
jgi:hypothetical protein